MREQSGIKCIIMRGGTSTGVFFDEKALPADAEARERLILSLMGSPDPRQIDGLGGADPLTSKICIIGSGAAHGADVDYTFGQVGIEESFVAFTTNCRNLSGAGAPYPLPTSYTSPRQPLSTPP